MNSDTSDNLTVGKVCLASYKRLLSELIQFRAAEVFLLRLQVDSMNIDSHLKAAHDEFVHRLQPNYETPSDYFLQRAFISLVAAFELFLQEVITAVVLVNPKKVGQIEFKLSEILDAAGPEELVRRSIEATLNKLMYKKPTEYLTEAAMLLSIDETPLKGKWPIFVEAKARRDLGVHNGWKCNSIYLRKVTEAGLKCAFVEEQMVFSNDHDYFLTVGEALGELGSSVMNAVIEKHTASLAKEYKRDGK
jgi:hypothetical protein